MTKRNRGTCRETVTVINCSPEIPDRLSWQWTRYCALRSARTVVHFSEEHTASIFYVFFHVTESRLLTRFVVLAAVLVTVCTFLDVSHCSLVDMKSRFEGTCCFHPLDFFFPEVWFNRISRKINSFDQTTWRHISEGCNPDLTPRVLSGHLSSGLQSETLLMSVFFTERSLGAWSRTSATLELAQLVGLVASPLGIGTLTRWRIHIFLEPFGLSCNWLISKHFLTPTSAV